MYMYYKYSYMYMYASAQIGSTMVSVCTIENTFWANWKRFNAVSDNIIIINCAIGPKRELRSAK